MISLSSGIVVALLSVTLSAGCGSKYDEDMPTTYQVTGQVKFRDGKPYRGGSIELRGKKNNEKYWMHGRISNAGDFALKTIGGKEPVDGAIAGEFRVTLVPDQGDDQTDVRRQQMLLKKTYQIEARDGFELVITVDAPGSR